MVLMKEYRICMPLSVEEYKIGQLYMIARHSHEQTDSGEGVEVVENVECEDPEHGKGQYTEKRIHLSSRLPYWIQAIIPKLFYVTEKAWNYYPFTITEYTCSFVPKFSIHIKTKYENNNGSTDNCLDLSPEELQERIVEHVDIAYDEVSPKHYKEEEETKFPGIKTTPKSAPDVRFFQSQKTGRGPLVEGWRDSVTPIMCSYKLVQVSFEVWGLQTRAEDIIQRGIKEILLLGHRQAFAWIDEWHGMTLEDVRNYETKMQEETNKKMTLPSVKKEEGNSRSSSVEGTLETETDLGLPSTPSSGACVSASSIPMSPASGSPTTPTTPKTPKSWFSWS